MMPNEAYVYNRFEPLIFSQMPGQKGVIISVVLLFIPACLGNIKLSLFLNFSSFTLLRTPPLG